MSERGRRLLKLALRAGISAALVAFVLRQLDLAAHERVLRMRARRAANACGHAFLVQALQLGCMAALLAALRVPSIDWASYLAVFLASSLAATLPLSIGGLGMREVTFLYGLRLFGLAPEKGVLAASAFFLITVLSSLPGVCFLHRFRLAKQDD